MLNSYLLLCDLTLCQLMPIMHNSRINAYTHLLSPKYAGIITLSTASISTIIIIIVCMYSYHDIVIWTFLLTVCCMSIVYYNNSYSMFSTAMSIQPRCHRDNRSYFHYYYGASCCSSRGSYAHVSVRPISVCSMPQRSTPPHHACCTCVFAESVHACSSQRFALTRHFVSSGGVPWPTLWENLHFQQN